MTKITVAFCNSANIPKDFFLDIKLVIRHAKLIYGQKKKQMRIPVLEVVPPCLSVQPLVRISLGIYSMISSILNLANRIGLEPIALRTLVLLTCSAWTFGTPG